MTKETNQPEDSPSCHVISSKPRDADVALCREMAKSLPSSFFARSPIRIVYLIQALAALAAHLGVTRLVLLGRISWDWYALTLILATYSYPYFTFTLHELEHGAVLRRGLLRLAASWLAAIWIPFQPQFWRCMHGHHHQHSNQEPDTHRLHWFNKSDFGSRCLAFNFSNPISYLTAPFATQILYGYSLVQFFRGRVKYRISKRIVLRDLTLHAILLSGLFFLLGHSLVILGLLPPFLLGSVLMNSYMLSQHLTRPFVQQTDTLKSATSVWLYFGYSHMDIGRHVEHHLFPKVPGHKLKLLSNLLRQRYPNNFKEKPLCRALWELFRLPGYYYEPETLTDRRGIVRVPIE